MAGAARTYGGELLDAARAGLQRAELSWTVARVQQTSEGDKSWREPQWLLLYFFPPACQESQKDGETIELCLFLFLVSGKKNLS